MKKIFLLTSLCFLIFMSSCRHSSDMSEMIIGDWETIHIKEQGNDCNGYYFDDSYEVTPEVTEEWFILSINKASMKIKEINAEHMSGIKNIPFPYTFKGDKLTSLLLDSDNTRTVTVSFTDDDTMIFYMDDSGQGDRYEQWTTFRRLK